MATAGSARVYAQMQDGADGQMQNGAGFDAMTHGTNGSAPSSPIVQRLSAMLDKHERVRAAIADRDAAYERIRVALGDWFPEFSVIGNYGYEEQNDGNTGADTHLPPKEVDFKITQQLWDFGSTDAAVQRARLVVNQAEEIVAQTRQDVLLEGLSSQLQVITTKKVLEFRKQSEANIMRQTELEDARVQIGSGFSTDVLQAKTQLAGAQAARVRAEGDFQQAINRYRAVFGSVPDDFQSLQLPAVPEDLLPGSLDEAVSIALENSHQIRASRYLADIAKQEGRKTASDTLYPTLNAIAESRHKQDVAGTLGSKTEQLIKVELTYTLNMGLTAVNTLKAADLTYEAAAKRLNDTRDLVEEQVRNSWQQLQTARANLQFLRNQANIAAEFLDLARNERKLGLRSLIDVLAGETALINARSEAANAETAYAVAAFTLLGNMGELHLAKVYPAPSTEGEEPVMLESIDG